MNERVHRPHGSSLTVALLTVLVAGCAGSITSPAPQTGAPATGRATGESSPAPPPTASGSPPTVTSRGSPRGEASRPTLTRYGVPAGAHPHDVSPAVDGGVWYTGQANGTLGHLDPRSGRVREVRLGAGSAPHGVITGPDGAAWITDGGLNAIVSVDGATNRVTRFPLPASAAEARLNTAVFDRRGTLWFTGQAGFFGSLDVAAGRVRVFEAPRGRGPYGITATPDGEVYYASLAGSHIARIDPETGRATVIEPPTPGQGARRVWSDSHGRIWVSEWNAGQVGRYDPETRGWREWRLPGESPQPYAVYVDERDDVWLTDFGSNSLVRFDPDTETFDSFPLPEPGAAVRQLHGRPGEVWGAESGTDRLVRVALPRR